MFSLGACEPQLSMLSKSLGLNNRLVFIMMAGLHHLRRAHGFGSRYARFPLRDNLLPGRCPAKLEEAT